jgi:hypothetical protein
MYTLLVYICVNTYIMYKPTNHVHLFPGVMTDLDRQESKELTQVEGPVY